MAKFGARANFFDRLVGERIKDIRLSKGWTQTKLANALSVTCQQVQKYESGTNRVWASTLFVISLVLGVPVEKLCVKPPSKKRPRTDISGVPRTRLTLELYRHALSLNAQNRRLILDMAKAAARK